MAFIVWLGRIALVIRLHHSRNGVLPSSWLLLVAWAGRCTAHSPRNHGVEAATAATSSSSGSYGTFLMPKPDGICRTCIGRGRR